MKIFFANTTNHRRFVMFTSAGIFGIFTALIFYQVPFYAFKWDIFNTAFVGLLIFESLYGAKKWLSLKTLPVYVILVTLISQWLYFALFSIEDGASISSLLSLEPFNYLFATFPYILYFFIESCVVTGFAYYLITYYRKNGWVHFVEHENDSNKFRVRDLAVGFFGWFLFANLVTLLSFSLQSAVMGFLSIFFMLSISMALYLFSQNRNWFGIGIISAILTNAGLWLWLVNSSSLLFIPLPIGLIFLAI